MALYTPEPQRFAMPPNKWRPRPHQDRLWKFFKGPDGLAFDGAGKTAVEIAHRRWGKDEIAFQIAAQASVARPATYWHMLPEYEQARKAIWTMVNPHTGVRRIDEMFPPEWRENMDDRQMFIRFKWGATWQVVGSDNFKALVGAGVAGIVFSEWSKAHPGALAYLNPMLTENNGWKLFITTPEGRNHAHGTYDDALRRMKLDPSRAFAEIQTVEDSVRMCAEMGMPPPFSLERVEEERISYRSIFGQQAGDAMIEQEYYCSWQAAVLGAYWGKEMERAERENRICDLGIIPNLPVHKAWDIGMDDPMAIWCFQVGPGFLHIVDYCEGSGYGFDFYADWLKERGYNGIDWVPHDAKQREPGSPGGRTRIETMVSLGLHPRLVPDHKPIDRINAGRRVIPVAYFDAERCARGLECLREYKADWDQINRVFRKTAKHNWASHGADAWGHMSVAVEVPKVKPTNAPQRQQIVVKPFTVNDLLRQSKPNRKWT